LPDHEERSGDYQVTTAQTAALAFQDSRNALFDNTIPGLPQTRNLALRAGLRWRGLEPLPTTCISAAQCGLVPSV
jgi:hypothetical protein